LCKKNNDCFPLKPSRTLFYGVTECYFYPMPVHPKSFASIVADLAAIYKHVDLHAKQLMEIQASRFKCRRRCNECCMDNITVFQIEADNIRHYHTDLLKNGKARPLGACAFLDEQGACRIYDARPYVCRTQGLPLHWLEQTDKGQTVAMRDICPLNEKGPAVETLPEETCWRIGPTEETLAKLQFAAYGEALSRVKLRDLFSR